MKVLFSHNVPFFLAHGGTQTLLESLMSELSGLGVTVEPERWWDPHQTGDILHYMGRPATVTNVQLAQKKGMKVVMTENLDQTASRTPRELWLQRAMTRAARRFLPGLTNRLAWDVYQKLDAMVYVVPHEWEAAQYLFDATPSRGHVIPQGLPARVLETLREPQPEEDYLISIAVVSARKNTLKLAEAAREAAVPVVFVGKPLSETDDYMKRFRECVDGRNVRYAGFVSESEKQRLVRGARGFVLLSQFESGCIALYEAAAAGLPLLLPELPWARRVYGNLPGARCIPLNNSSLPAALRAFHAQAHRRAEPTFPILSWKAIAQRYLDLYERLLGS